MGSGQASLLEFIRGAVWIDEAESLAISFDVEGLQVDAGASFVG